MSIVDLTLVILLTLFAVRGYFRGLFLEVLSILGIFAGFLSAVRYNQVLTVLAQEYWKVSPLFLKTIGFFLIFFAVYFVFNLLGWLLQRWARTLFLAGFNRVGGVFIGVGKGAAFLALILFFLGSSSLIPNHMKQTVEGSYLVPPLNRFGKGLVQIGKERLFFQETGEQGVEEASRPGFRA